MAILEIVLIKNEFLYAFILADSHSCIVLHFNCFGTICSYDPIN